MHCFAQDCSALYLLCRRSRSNRRCCGSVRSKLLLRSQPFEPRARRCRRRRHTCACGTNDRHKAVTTASLHTHSPDIQSTQGMLPCKHARKQHTCRGARLNAVEIARHRASADRLLQSIGRGTATANHQRRRCRPVQRSAAQFSAVRVRPTPSDR